MKTLEMLMNDYRRERAKEKCDSEKMVDTGQYVACCFCNTLFYRRSLKDKKFCITCELMGMDVLCT